jgi:hypothetical protein
MNQNQIPANIMMSNMMNNNGPSISSMGGGTPISQLRKDVAIVKSQKEIETDIYADEYTHESERNSHIKNLVEDINNEIEDGKKKKIKVKDTDTDTEEEKPKKKKSKGSFFNFTIPEMIKDPILIWVIYMLMSQNFFKKMIGKYIAQINPNEEGIVSFTGVAVYGLVLVVLFTLIKFLLKQLKKY